MMKIFLEKLQQTFQQGFDDIMNIKLGGDKLEKINMEGTESSQ